MRWFNTTIEVCSKRDEPPAICRVEVIRQPQSPLAAGIAATGLPPRQVLVAVATT
jgi:hypothetical protein